MGGEEPRATGLTRNHRKDGETIWCEWYHSALLDDDGEIVSILSFVQDVSLAHPGGGAAAVPGDARRADRAAEPAAAARAARRRRSRRRKRSGRRVGVLFIDLDRFKNVNDTLGHRIGDELLKAVTQALVGALRETDLLARLGGDEFMVIVEDFDDPAVLGRIAQKLLDAIAQPFKIEEHDIYVTSSIGIAVYPDDSDDPEELLKHADVAMYRSKELGRNTYQFLDANLAEHRLRQHTLETALRAALEGRRCCGCTTSRWCASPTARSSAPRRCCAGTIPSTAACRRKVFIPLAEESGLIHALGEWVLRTAAAQCVAWRDAGPAADGVGQPVGAPVLPRGPRAAHLRHRAAGRAASRRGSSSR